MKQPLLGIVASLLVIVFSLGFIALFAFPTFGTWVAFLTICFIPMQIITSVTWGCRHPGFAAARPQPLRGILLTLLALAVGAIVAAVHFSTVGGGINPPTPMLAMCIIASVVITFWLAIMWGGWPFNKLIKHPVGAGFAILVAQLRHQLSPVPPAVQLRLHARRAGICPGSRSARPLQRLERAGVLHHRDCRHVPLAQL